MNIKNFLKGIDWKTAFGITSAIVTGIVAVGGSLSQQKKDKEFEEMKKAFAELSRKD